ncbi:rop guanine nucleotide exchange factor 3-like [Senna tora]|uniref:Rop guanine nucleotide exchange factor 3-like n=1 Tax=Senna tora TaxID=362788 RepID=A0A834WM78_9FABA|nr:rop guanine nucleotide exchange factor 3-like [Senna tora]
MEKSSTHDEKYDVGFRPSVDLNGHLAIETPENSPLSGDSFAYFPSDSEASNLSVDDHCYASEPEPSRWPARPNGAVLSRLGMKQQQKNSMDDNDLLWSATVFGQNLKLEPLKAEKKAMWRREMNCLLSLCDYIVEFAPTAQYLEDGTVVEMMRSRARSDIYINLPALGKLDTMLIEILDSFDDSEFWYVEQGSISGESSSGSRGGSFRRIVQRKDEKWWLPVACVLPGGLSDKSRKQLREKRDCAKQVHKAAMAINTSVIAEMEIPETYMASLPKSGRASMGESLYRYMCMANKLSPHTLLNLKISSEHEALEVADRIETSMYTWRRKACLTHSKSSWSKVKELMSEADRIDKNYVLAEKAQTLLLCLKHTFPQLSQTSLDICKIQYNRDVGKAILESYSRVLEGLAFNIVAWIEDVLYEDKSMRKKGI